MTEEDGGLLSLRLQRVTQTEIYTHTHTHTHPQDLRTHNLEWPVKIRPSWAAADHLSWEPQPSSLKFILIITLTGFPGGTVGKEPTCQCRKLHRHGFLPWVRRIPWRRAWQHTPVFWTGIFHDRGACWAVVHGVSLTKSQIWLRRFGTQAHTHPYYLNGSHRNFSFCFLSYVVYSL